jgi:hypothetical protein
LAISRDSHIELLLGDSTHSAATRECAKLTFKRSLLRLELCSPAVEVLEFDAPRQAIAPTPDNGGGYDDERDQHDRHCRASAPAARSGG